MNERQASLIENSKAVKVKEREILTVIDTLGQL
jgi:hypothetical protein